MWGESEESKTLSVSQDSAGRASSHSEHWACAYSSTSSSSLGLLPAALPASGMPAGLKSFAPDFAQLRFWESACSYLGLVRTPDPHLP